MCLLAFGLTFLTFRNIFHDFSQTTWKSRLFRHFPVKRVKIWQYCWARINGIVVATTMVTGNNRSTTWSCFGHLLSSIVQVCCDTCWVAKRANLQQVICLCFVTKNCWQQVFCLCFVNKNRTSLIVNKYQPVWLRDMITCIKIGSPECFWATSFGWGVNRCHKHVLIWRGKLHDINLSIVRFIQIK